MNRPAPTIAISSLDPAYLALGEQLSQETQLPLTDCEDVRYALHLTIVPISTLPGYRLQFIRPDQPRWGAVYPEFASGRLEHRRRFGGGLGQAIARAIGLTNQRPLRLFDVTAGFGKDAFVLASLGAQVTMVERSLFMVKLLENAMQRAQASKATQQIIHQRLTLISGDSMNVLSGLCSEQIPDVIYMDPMYPPRNKSAKVKKDMEILQWLIGDDLDSSQLLIKALHYAKQKVVVKRPRFGATILGARTSGSIITKSTRYDIYPATTKG